MKKFTMLISTFLLFFVFTSCQMQELDFGIENAYIVEQSEKVKLAENAYGQVFLLAEDSNEESGQVAKRHLAIVLEDRKIVKALTESYDGDITLCDFDGNEDMEIAVQETVGSTGGYGNYLSRIFDFKNGELVELFSSRNESGDLFDTGFSITILENKEFEIKNVFTNYSQVFRLEDRLEEYYDFWYEEDGTPKNENLMVDSFYEFLPQDVDGDGVYEIKGKQYTSLIGHADGIGIANTVLKYNKEKTMFEVVDASFELLT